MTKRKPIRKAKKAPRAFARAKAPAASKLLRTLVASVVMERDRAKANIPKVRIERQTDEQLEAGIKQAVDICPDFWVICYGIHAFFEQRRRKAKRRVEQRMQRADIDPLDFDWDRVWGSD